MNGQWSTELPEGTRQSFAITLLKATAGFWIMPVIFLSAMFDTVFEVVQSRRIRRRCQP